MVDDPGKSSTEALAPTELGADTPTRASTTDIAAGLALPAEGYEIGDVIGRGGMGEVFAARDKRFDRDVAMKRMRSPAPTGEARSRFLREAKIQARLDHPAVVPVHDLDTDAAGRPFFTMKRLVGRTLAHRLADGASLNRLLRAYAEVCLAIEYAHLHGVIHRDLKPSNIMLGEYGEVYVLDWGVARVISDPREAETLQPLERDDITTIDDTKTGALLGTPGYMAPEQLRGLTPTPKADVYALGAILFEILAGEPLHPRGEAAVGSTLANAQASPLERRGGERVPPELDALCVSALAENPELRPSAHDIAEAVQDYLDGDRDLERRRRLAAEQLANARTALAGDDDDARATAFRRAGRALALDPESKDAAQLVSSLLLEPPEKMPAELTASLDAYERQQSRHRSGRAIWAYLSLVAFAPLLLVLDVKNWTFAGALYGTIAVAIVVAYDAFRDGRPSVPSVLLVNLALVVLFTRILGPFILTPLLICSVIIGITSIRRVNSRPWIVVVWTVAAVLGPIVLEWAGLLPQTWAVVHGATVSASSIFGSSPGDAAALVAANLTFTLVVALVALAFVRKRQESQRQLFIQAWHLRQLIPQDGVTPRRYTAPTPAQRVA